MKSIHGTAGPVWPSRQEAAEVSPHESPLGTACEYELMPQLSNARAKDSIVLFMLFVVDFFWGTVGPGPSGQKELPTAQ